MKNYKDAQRQKQANTIKGSGNPNWKGGRIQKICVRCDSPFLVYPNRANTQTHCSLICANRDMADAQRGIVDPKKIHYGKDNGCWKGGKQIYNCNWCGDAFQAYSYQERKFCSITCARMYQWTGETNPKWKGGITPPLRILRCNKAHRDWQGMIFQRDNYTCQKCGRVGGDLHSHHIKPFATYPELRFDINNGQTLCRKCHSQVS